MTTNNAANIGAITGTQIINQVGHGFVLGEVLYLNGTTWTKAIATSSSAAVVAGIVAKSIDADNFILQFDGIVVGLAGLTAGAVYYLSSATAGAITATLSDVGSVLQVPVLLAISTTTGLFIAQSGDPGVGTFGANILINSGFDIATRGTTFTSATSTPNNDDTYTFDQTILLSNGNNIVDLLRVAGSGPSSYQLRGTQVTANQQWGILKPLSFNDTSALRTLNVTFSITLSKEPANATLETMRLGILEWTGTADAITSDVVATWVAGANPTLAANWAYINTPVSITTTTTNTRYSTTAAVGSGANNLAVFCWVDDADATAADVMDMSSWKLEVGVTPTYYCNKLYSQEESDCSFYLQGYPASSSFAAAFFDTTTALKGFSSFKLMRVAPTITLSATTAFDAERVGTSATTTTTNAAASITTRSSRWTAVANSASTQGFPTYLSLAASQYIYLSAEL